MARDPVIQVVDLFCGVGGLTYGLRKAGLKVIAGLDIDATCKDAFEINNNCQFIEADIAKYDFSPLKKRLKKNKFSALVGCAPCQVFSSHSFKYKNKEEDTRRSLLDHFARAVEAIQPDVVSMENVRGLEKTDVFRRFYRMLNEAGYYVDCRVVNSADYGISQARHRLVLLASKRNTIHVPTATHSYENFATVRDVIGKQPRLRSGAKNQKDPLHRSNQLAEINQARIRQSKPGGTWRDWDKALLPACFKKASGQSYTAVYGRMRWDSLGPTITTQFTNFGSGRFGHPSQNRALSLREGALLQTFPKKYNFGNLPTATLARHIGNAVPPKLAQAIGREIIRHINQL